MSKQPEKVIERAPPSDPPVIIDLEGGNLRGEVAGCPTGLSDSLPGVEEKDALQGSTPGTIFSPGEGVTEEQRRRSGLKD